MRSLIKLSFGLFAMAVFLAFSFTNIYGQTARVQVIHNSGDINASSVDIYLNDALLLDDFEFRQATPFIDAPAGTPIEIGIAPSTSQSAAEAIATFEYTLEENASYVIIANGVLTPDNYKENPDNKDIAFDLIVNGTARETAEDQNNVEFFVLHGSTDAPGVDIYARGVAKLVSGAMYKDFTNYISVPPAEYTIDITPANDENTIVKSVMADLRSLKGGTAVVFASGFFDPLNNQNGNSFEILAALSDGTVLLLPNSEDKEGTARVQVIHNSADVNVGVVDIYLDESLLIDDFEFRAATPFIDAPAGKPIKIGVAPANSMSSSDIIKSFNYNLKENGTYVIVANGVLDTTKYKKNPNNKKIDFDLIVNDLARETAVDQNSVEFFVLHGSTDAPAVDIYARDVAKIVANAQYKDFTDYISVPPVNYILDITPADDANTIVRSLTADLSSLQGGSAVVFASGFFDPSAENQNGEGFEVLAALPDGNVITFSTVTSVEQISNQVPDSYSLKQNYPNPFNPTTTINYQIPQAANVEIKVFNLLGKEVAELVNDFQEAGVYNVQFEASNFASGVYLYTISSGNFKQTKKLMVLK